MAGYFDGTLSKYQCDFRKNLFISINTEMEKDYG